MSDDWPAVTCLCPTYGRFQRLREALACFLAQDYPGVKRLQIYNDVGEPNKAYPHIVARNDHLHLRLPGRCVAAGVHTASGWVWAGCEELPGVRLCNCARRFENLGRKRQALLETAETPIAAHWDDDDLYLPHHLTRMVEALLAQGAGAVKSQGAYYLLGGRDGLECRGVHHNVFEGSMVFVRRDALRRGGYPDLHSGQAKALMGAFDRAGALYKVGDQEGGGVSYVYRWAEGSGHISAIGNKADAAEQFRRQNQDFGSGEPLTPADLNPYWQAIRQEARA